MINYWILFLFNPLLSLIYSLRGSNNKVLISNTVWAFVSFYGFTYAIGKESQGSDINRYISQYKSYQDKEIDFTYVKSLMFQGKLDFIETYITFFASQISSYDNILTFIYAVIYGFFYSRIFAFLYSFTKVNNTRFFIFIFLISQLIIPFWNIGGIRMWLASQIFVYACLMYFFFNKKYKAIILLCLIPFVHFSFLPISFISLLIFNININKIYINKLLFILFIATSFQSTVEVKFVNTIIMNYLPFDLTEETSSYVDDENVNAFRSREILESNKSLHAVFYKKVLYILIKIWIVWIFILSYKSSDIEIRNFFEKNINLFNFIFIIWIFSNLLYSFPSGERFSKVSSYLSMLYILYFFSIINVRFTKHFNKLKIASYVLGLFFVLVSIRTMLYSVSLTTVLGNPLTAFLFLGESHTALNDLIK